MIGKIVKNMQSKFLSWQWAGTQWAGSTAGELRSQAWLRFSPPGRPCLHNSDYQSVLNFAYLKDRHKSGHSHRADGPGEWDNTCEAPRAELAILCKDSRYINSIIILYTFIYLILIRGSLLSAQDRNYEHS